jgi:hypothetical protein
MNGWGYDDHDDEVAYEEGLIKAGQDRARRNLAAILTNLRKDCDDGREDYLDALDAVAARANIKTETEVRYVV